MSKDKCDGQERHRHYSLNDNKYMTHIHPHMEYTDDFNRLHHHAPLVHADFTLEELAETAQDSDDPSPFNTDPKLDITDRWYPR